MTWNGGSNYKNYTYDSAGRRIQENNTGTSRYFAYDEESRLTAITGAYSATYDYNGLDTRVEKTEASVTRNFMRDGVDVTSPVLNDGAAAYTPGISERRSSTTTYMHSGLKNADFQTDTSPLLVADRTYDAFGNLTGGSGTWQGPFGYAGQFGYQEDGSGLRLLGHRYYDPTIGRFLTRDPAKHGTNWYGYCGNNPVTNSDPSGLCFSCARNAGALVDEPLIGATIGGGSATMGGSAAGASTGTIPVWLQVFMASLGLAGAESIAHGDELVPSRRTEAIPVFRIAGDKSKSDGPYWTTEDPRLNPTRQGRGSPAWRLGLPQEYNDGSRVVIGIWDGKGGSFTPGGARPAPGYPESGGGPELFFPNGIGPHVVIIGTVPLIPPTRI